MKISEKIKSATDSLTGGKQKVTSKVRGKNVNKEDTLEYNRQGNNVAVFDDYIDASKVDVGNLQSKNTEDKYVIYENPEVTKKIRERFYKIDRVEKILYGLYIFVGFVFLAWYCLSAQILNSFPWGINIPDDIFYTMHSTLLIEFSNYLILCGGQTIQLIFVFFSAVTFLSLILLIQCSTVYEFDRCVWVSAFMILANAVSILVVGIMVVLFIALLISIAFLCINIYKKKVISGMVLDQEVQLDMNIREDYII